MRILIFGQSLQCPRYRGKDRARRRSVWWLFVSRGVGRVPHFSRPWRAAGRFVLSRIAPHQRIVACARKWMTAQQPQQSLRSAAHHPVPLHRLRRIFRTSWDEAARGRQHRRNRPLVRPQHLQHNELGKLTHSDRLQNQLAMAPLRHLLLGILAFRVARRFQRSARASFPIKALAAAAEPCPPASALSLRRRASLRSLPRRSR